MNRRRTPAALVAALLAIAPLLLAPKGCEALVGNDRKTCGGLAGTPCPHDQFCDFSPETMCGAGDQTGVCGPVPRSCTEQYEPVCGCDQQTYGNVCLAHLAGMSVASAGECGGGGVALCGGLTGASCAADQFCNFPLDALCGFADAMGTCETRPSGCDDTVATVCGCDGFPYRNACEAHAAGMSVANTGECDGSGGSGDPCGGLNGESCPVDEFCDFPLDAMCGFADAPGACASIPDTCASTGDPACGCNGTTYGNACEAHRAGISVNHEGPCP